MSGVDNLQAVCGRGARYVVINGLAHHQLIVVGTGLVEGGIS